jgi:hypothetical protein
LLRRSLARALVLATAATAALTLPSTAATHTGPVRDLVTSLPLGLGTTTYPLTAERMVGVTWQTGTAAVDVRWHTARGWSAWAVAEQDSGDSDVGLPGTKPLWRPVSADRVQLRTAGAARGLHLVKVTDGVAKKVRGAVAEAAEGRAVLGSVRSRAQWGADESMVRSAPKYAKAVHAVVVHHTDNVNGYQPSDVPAMIRADYSYHVNGRGWSDIGYNLLVDQFGQVWEGRRGGLGRATIGAHAQGFNTGTLGVAMLGDMTHTTASPAAERALERVIDYAAVTWGFDPEGTVRLRSAGSPRYPSGQVVTLHRVFGHMDTGQTDCPGSLQGRLPTLRALAKQVTSGPPRILSASVSGAPLHAPQGVVVNGKLSAAIVWNVIVTAPDGTQAAAAYGIGHTVRLSWDGTTDGPVKLPARPGSYFWRLVASDSFHPNITRSGTFQVGLPDPSYLTQLAGLP